MRKIILTTLFSVLILLSANSFAQGIYLGAGIGNTFFSSEINDALDQAKEISDNSTAWKLFAGYHITSFLNIEGGYRSFGNINSDVDGDLYESKTSGWDVEAMGRFKIVIIDLFAKAGAMFWTNDVNFLGQSSNDSGTDFFWGIGAGVHLGPLGVRLEWESVEISGSDNLSMVSLGATFGF